MALFEEEASIFLDKLDDIVLNKKGAKRSDVLDLLAKRDEAREKKDFAAADEVKAALTEMGIELRDGQRRSWEAKV